MITETYSPKNVIISIAGTALEGWESLSISRATANTTQQVSADGKMVGITYSADSTGTAEITVQQQNSAVNVFMAALQLAQDEIGKPYKFAMAINDPSGSALVLLNDAFLDVPADMDLSSEQTDRTWGLFVGDVKYIPKPVGIDPKGTVTNAATAADAALKAVKALGINQ